MIRLIISAIFVFNACHILNANPLQTIKNNVGNARFIETDMLMPLTRSLGSASSINIWPSGLVPYIIDAAFTTAERTLITDSMAMITTKSSSCITFTPKTSAHSNWINIKSLDGCYSFVGYIGGEQDISLAKDGCLYKGTIVHELYHALGFHHEQNRPDRDDYITVNFNNIASNFRDQFEKYNGLYYSTAYDYGSIMHYASYAFSSNGGTTIIPRQAGVTLIAAYDKTDAQIMTASDISALRQRYQCTGATVATTTVATTTAATPATAATTTVSSCTNADSTCDLYSLNKDTYCSTTANYMLNNVAFPTACRKLCGICTAPLIPGTCVDQWFCAQYASEATKYCSNSGVFYKVNGIFFRTACPNVCNTCGTASAPQMSRSLNNKIISLNLSI